MSCQEGKSVQFQTLTLHARSALISSANKTETRRGSYGTANIGVFGFRSITGPL